MAVIHIAKLIIKDRFHKHIKQVFEKDKKELEDLEANFTLPSPVPKIQDMTKPQLVALKQAISQQLIKLTMIESLVKTDFIKIDEELSTR